MAESRVPATESTSLQPARPPRWRGHGLGIAATLVVLVLTTVAAAWYTTIRTAPATRADDPPVASTANPPAVKPESRAGAPPPKVPRQSNARQKPAPILMVPSGAPFPVAPSKTDTDEVLVVPVPNRGEGPVLSAKDAGVTPPVLLSPRRSAPLQMSEDTEDLSAIDLVISDSGEVESVKLVSPVRDYREAMMLSAVKAWRFKPASVEGMPVRYLMRIHISVASVTGGNR